jgi:hypothetical protein
MIKPLQISALYLQKIEALKITDTVNNHKISSFRFLKLIDNKLLLPKVAISPAYRYFLGSKDICVFLALQFWQKADYLNISILG